MLAKTTTFYIKCSTKEAAAIRAVAKKEQRTIHNWLRVVVFADVMKTDPNLLYPPLKCELCGAFMNTTKYPPSSRSEGYALKHLKNSCERSEKWFAWPGEPHDGCCPGLVEILMERTSS